MLAQCIPFYLCFYLYCDALLKYKSFQDDPQAKMTTTEVLFTALVAAWCFGNNHPWACQAVAESGLVPQMLSQSRFHRR